MSPITTLNGATPATDSHPQPECHQLGDSMQVAYAATIVTFTPRGDDS